ncbi:MAG: flavodoxin family protein [Bacteroidaceae bacterium]|nr:flavodoxin family protein [Bacteroidaceae bacterium]
MSKITLITASARKNGNSNQMANWFTEEAKTLGAEVTAFDAVKLNLDGCHFCNACFKNNHVCAFEYGFDPIAEAVMDSEILVFAMPVYFFSMPGQMKNILDHFYSFLVGGKSMGKKTIVAMGTSGQPVDSNVWEGVTAILSKTAGMMGWDYEELTYGVMNNPGAILDTDAEEKVKALAQKLLC